MQLYITKNWSCSSSTGFCAEEHHTHHKLGRRYGRGQIVTCSQALVCVSNYFLFSFLTSNPHPRYGRNFVVNMSLSSLSQVPRPTVVQWNWKELFSHCTSPRLSPGTRMEKSRTLTCICSSETSPNHPVLVLVREQQQTVITCNSTSTS